MEEDVPPRTQNPWCFSAIASMTSMTSKLLSLGDFKAEAVEEDLDSVGDESDLPPRLPEFCTNMIA